MDGIRIILFGVAILILIINFFINSGNLIKIISYCFQTNTLSKYWSLFYKSSVSGRAIISTVIGFILALIVFIIITPFVLFRRSYYGKKISLQVEEGLLFQYEDLEKENENLFYNTNINQILNLNLKDIKVTGKIRIDALILISEIDIICKSENKEFKYSVMENVKLNENMEALVPILLTVEGKNIPTYFIFNETHKRQFNKIKNRLYNQGYKNCAYFSAIRM